MKETTIETKNCKKCGTSFEITDKDLEFYDKISPIFAGKKYSIPTPTFCPDCRQQRRLAWRNENKLYKRKCDFSDKPLISTYSPDNKYHIYDYKIWWSDQWNAMDYGQNFNFDRPFFEQFDELLKKTPRGSILNTNTTNCEYGNDIESIKNSYLIFNGGNAENLYYVDAFLDVKNCIDCDWIINNCELCYDSYKLENCYKCFFSYFCSDSRDCILCYDCHGSQNCIGCVNLYNKQYYIFNKQYSKEEYQEYISKLNLSDDKTLEKLKEKFSQLKLANIHCETRKKNCSNCKGDNILNSSDSNHVYDCFNLTHSKYAWNCGGNYIYDSYNTGNTGELAYENIANYRISKTTFVSHCWDSQNLLYCEFCFFSEYLFGCSGLHHKKYCIFNKQYTKDKYEKLVPKIITHMVKTGERGEFFPSSISPFGYNETIANEYFPLTKEEATKGGFNWQNNEYPINIPEGMARIEAKDLPKLEDLDKNMEKKILATAIICEKSGKPYRIIKQELEFYKKYKLPLPRKHQEIRHMERIKFRNPRKLYDRKCKKCGIEIKTTYSPDRPEIVFCQACYSDDVY